MSRGRDLFFMALLTTACSTLLVVTDALVRTATAADPALARSVLALLPADGAAGGGDVGGDPAAAFAARFRALPPPPGVAGFYVSRQRPTVAVAEVAGAGMCGRLRLLVAYDHAAATVLGVGVLEHSETPGLGARIAEGPFLGQFRGLRAPEGVRAGGGRQAEGGFDAITGATVSSRAVADLVNAGLAAIRRAAAAGELAGRPGG